MSRTTKIEWATDVWNCVVGCSIASPGCKNCYAMRMAHRLGAFGQEKYQGVTKSTKAGPVWTGVMRQATRSVVEKPLRIAKPAIIFVNSMSDLFHPDVEDAWRDDAFDVMCRAPQHVYQVLTKRPEVAVEYLWTRRHLHNLPQVWLGVSVERSNEKWRIDVLREAPVATRFLSVEPLIAPLGRMNLEGIHWVITGGESGPGARPCHPEWFREVGEQCQAAGVPWFHKQNGTWGNNPMVWERGLSIAEAKRRDLDPKAKGGATLDGRLYREMPARDGQAALI